MRAVPAGDFDYEQDGAHYSAIRKPEPRDRYNWCWASLSNAASASAERIPFAEDKEDDVHRFGPDG